VGLGAGAAASPLPGVGVVGEAELVFEAQESVPATNNVATRARQYAIEILQKVACYCA